MATTQTVPIAVVPRTILARGNRGQSAWVKLDFVLNGVPGRLASHRIEIIDGVSDPIELIQYNADPLRGWSDVRLRGGKKAELPNGALRFHHDQGEANAARAMLDRITAEIRKQELRLTQPPKPAYHNHTGGPKSRTIAARGRLR